VTKEAPFREQLVFHRGQVRLPTTLLKVCVHRADESLELRFRGDMLLDIDTYAGKREEVYVCIQCGKRKNAKGLLELLQAYMLLGGEVCV